MNRRRMLHPFKTEVGEYEDAAVLPVDTDPQLFLSRNRQPQPFHLVCAKDNVLALLSGSAQVQLRDSSVYEALPVDLYFNGGVRLDTDVGVFELTIANALGRLR